MQFRYTIIDYTTNPYGESTVVQEPIGWDGLILKIDRDREYHGFFEYSENELSGLSFYNDAHDILKAAFDDYGIEAFVEIKIEIFCEDWQELYTGRVDFDRTTFSCGLKGCFADVAISKSNCLMAFNNRIDQPVSLGGLTTFGGVDLNEYAGLRFMMELPGKKTLFAFSGTSTFENTFCDFNTPTSGCDEQASYNPLYTFGGDIHRYQHFWQFPILNVSDSSLEVIENSEFQLHNELTSPFIGWYDYCPGIYQYDGYNSLNCSNQVTILFSGGGDFSDLTTETRSYRASAQIVIKRPGQPAELLAEHIIQHCTPFCGLSFTKPFTFNLAASVQVNPGDRIYCHLVVNQYTYIGSGSGAVANPTQIVWDFYDYDISISSVSNCEATEANVNLVNESLSRITEIITDDCLRVKSDYFGRTDSEPYTSDSDGCGSLEVITDGLSIRQALLQNGNPPIYTLSFKDLITGLSAIHNLGYGIEDNTVDGGDWIRVEPFEYFYDNTVVKNLPNVPNLKSTVLTEMYVTKFMTGYQKWQAEEFGGQQDFHGIREYRTSLKTIYSVLDRICKFIASGYSIEVTRRQFGSNNKDWRFDNDTFIICVKRASGNYEVDIPNIDTSGNIYDPNTTYNIAITPARNAMRWVKRIAQSLLPNWAGNILSFAAGQGNYVAEALQNGDCVIEAAQLSESQNIESTTFATLPTPLMYNILDEFEYPLSYADYQLLIANKYKKLTYSCNNGENITGYIKSITYKPTDGKATFQLIRAYE